MAFKSTGTPIEQKLVFNSAVITINDESLIDVTDLSVTKQFTEKSFYALNSIFKRAIRRSEFQFELGFTIHTSAEVLDDLFFSSSSVVSATEKVYNVKDGQQDDVSNFFVTAYSNEEETEGLQFDVVNPVILNISPSSAAQEFAGYDVTVACTKIIDERRIDAN